MTHAVKSTFATFALSAPHPAQHTAPHSLTIPITRTPQSGSICVSTVYTQSHTHQHTPTHTHTRINIPLHTLTHTSTYPYTHSHTHTHTLLPRNTQIRFSCSFEI